MKILLQLSVPFILIAISTILAQRWVRTPRRLKQNKRSVLGFITLIFVSTALAIVGGQFQTQISIAYFDPNDFPGDRGLTADMAYDGVGNNVVGLFLGWLLVPIGLMIARAIWPKPKQ